MRQQVEHYPLFLYMGDMSFPLVQHSFTKVFHYSKLKSSPDLRSIS